MTPWIDRFPERGELVNALGVAIALLAIIVWVGFPIHFPDSTRYLSAALEFHLNNYATVTLAMLLGPLVMVVGPWAFVAVHAVLLGGVSIALARSYFDESYPFSILIAVLLSAAGVMAMTVMMDIHTVIGALALMVLAVRRSGFCWLALLAGLFSHSSALLILPVMGVFLALLSRNRRLLGALALALAVWGVVTAAVHWFAGGELRWTPRYSVHFAVARVMWDVPASIESFASDHPDSAIAKHKDLLLEASQKKGTGRFSGETMRCSG